MPSLGFGQVWFQSFCPLEFPMWASMTMYARAPSTPSHNGWTQSQDHEAQLAAEALVKGSPVHLKRTKVDGSMFTTSTRLRGYPSKGSQGIKELKDSRRCSEVCSSGIHVARGFEGVAPRICWSRSSSPSSRTRLVLFWEYAWAPTGPLRRHIFRSICVATL